MEDPSDTPRAERVIEQREDGAAAPAALDDLAAALVAARGRPVRGEDGDDVIGHVGQVFTDYRERAQWVAIKVGGLAAEERFAPAAGAEVEADGVRLAVPGASVGAAPELGVGAVMDASHVKELRRHYGVEAPPGQI